LLHAGDDVLAGTKYTMRTEIMYELVNPWDEKKESDEKREEAANVEEAKGEQQVAGPHSS
jgi:hypothetical protein